MIVDALPQIPSINFWGGPRRPTSERGRDSATPHARAIVDDHGRIMVLMTHNTDIGDSFEREGDSRQYFLQFSVHGYAFGVNIAALRDDALSGTLGETAGRAPSARARLLG